MAVSIYRSPNSSKQNNQSPKYLLEKLKDISSHNKIIFGDFNFPNIDWKTWTGKDEDSMNFIKSIRNGFLNQYIESPTRARGTDIPSILDLVLTDNPDLIDELSINSPIGKSDHAVIEISINNHHKKEIDSKISYNFEKADFPEINNKLKKTNLLDAMAIHEGNIDNQ